MKALIYFVLAITGLNLIRMAFYLITSNIHIMVESWQSFRHKRLQTAPKSPYLPTVTVLIPAHNEELCIEGTLASLCQSVYPPSKLSIAVINDGSTDETAKLVKKFIRNYHGNIHVRLLNQRNKGKAAALNRALRCYVKSTLVFCIDADSKVDTRAIRSMAQHFRNQKVIAGSSNVNIVEDGTLLGLSQRFEYMMGYQMKRTETFCNIEYIIGGVGSMFRYKALRDVGLYDTNTQTEDIDLTMKLIDKFGNKNVRFIHVAEALTYTQPVSTMKALVAQRLRWKYGRWQTFLKHSHLFFSKSGLYNRRLTWVVLPMILLQELMFLLEPLVVISIFYAAIRVGSTTTFINALAIIGGYVFIILWSYDGLGLKERLRLSYYAPAMYFLLYFLSFADYMAMISGLLKIHKLKQSIKSRHSTWVSPQRVLSKTS